MAETQTSRIFLVTAVVLGVLATVLAFVFIQSTAGTDRGPHVRMVVAARDLRANAAIDPERDLKIEEIPAKFSSLAAQSLDPDARLTYKGQRLNRRVLAGQPIFLADLSAGGELSLQEPFRALTIPADAGLVIPGDYVQILVAHPEFNGGGAVAAGPDGAPPAAAPKPPMPSNNAVLVSNGRAYKVLAVNGSLSRTRSQATNADQFANSAAAKAITLEVTDDQAKEIVSAISPNPTRNLVLICPPVAAAPAPATNP